MRADCSTSKLLSPNRELRRIRDDVDCRVWLVAIIVFWERAAFWGMTAPWRRSSSVCTALLCVVLLISHCAENYMEHPLQHNDQQIPGALGLGQAMATRIYCAFYLFYYTTPIAIAIIADSHLGRYNTLMISVILYCLGCVILTLSSLPDSLERGWGSAGLAVSMLLIGLGAGGFRAITVPFMADQQPRREPRVELLRTGERVVTDYHLTKQYIYNLHYW
jgi:POT family proton-dependent oligopeptide transporter